MHSESEAHKNGITCLANDGNYIYSGCKDSVVKAWQFKELTKDQVEENKNKQFDENFDKSKEDTDQEADKYKVDLSSYMLGHSAQINSI